MIMIGTDSHKRTHTLVALDVVGRKVAEKTLPATTEGHLAIVAWAAQWPEVTFALEDCRTMTRRLERDLLGAGQRIRRVPTRLMAGARRAGRQPGKSDPIDAEAVALAALRHPDLPTAELDGPTRELRLLVEHRKDLVAERVRIQNRLRWHLRELDPTLAIPATALRRFVVMDALTERLANHPGMVARLARELLARCRELTVAINALQAELGAIVRRIAPTLLAVPGCGVLGAAVIVGETAGAHRFRSKDAYARFTGTAPVPVWSGATEGRVRLNRGGNRALNTALHMIAITQARGVGPGKDYMDKVQAVGKTRTEATRLLRRRLSDVAFAAVRADEELQQTAGSTRPETVATIPTVAA